MSSRHNPGMPYHRALIQTNEPEEHDRIAQFCSVTSSTPEQAKFYLEASNGQFDNAISMYFDEEHRDEQDMSDPEELDYQDGAPGPSDRPEVQHSGGRPRGRWLNPFHVLQRGLQIAFQTVHYTSSAAFMLGSRLLPFSLLHSLQGSLARISGGPENPRAAAASFRHHFQQMYGETGPEWREEPWEESSRLAHSQLKLLYVYLHSPNHQDTEQFCKETLCNNEFAQYVNRTFISWAGDITMQDAYRLSQSLRVTSYPYNVLLAFSGSRIRLVAAAVGALPPLQLLSLFQEAHDRHSASLIADQAEQNEQNVSRRLREEQDAEYHRSLEADRERERLREEAERKKAAAEQEAEQAAAKQRALKQEKEQQAADRVSILRNRRKSKAVGLGEEPAQGAPNSIHIRVRLPDGRNFQRRFSTSDPLQKAYDFVDSLEALDVLRYNLATSYPRRVFTEDILNQTFQDLGLHAQATLFVQSQDD